MLTSSAYSYLISFSFLVCGSSDVATGGQMKLNLPVPEFGSKESDGKENEGIGNNEAIYTIFNKQQTQFEEKMQKAFVDSADLKLFTIRHRLYDLKTTFAAIINFI